MVLFFVFVIPAQAGGAFQQPAGLVIQPLLWLFRFRENRLASVQVRPASLRAGFFLLLVQEKETKEKDSPASSPSAHPARKVRERRPRFADSASLR